MPDRSFLFINVEPRTVLSYCWNGRFYGFYRQRANRRRRQEKRLQRAIHRACQLVNTSINQRFVGTTRRFEGIAAQRWRLISRQLLHSETSIDEPSSYRMGANPLNRFS